MTLDHERERELDEDGRSIMRLWRTGELTAAIALAVTANAKAKTWLGEAHPRYANGLAALARIYFDAGLLEEAEAQLLEYADIEFRQFGPISHEYAEALSRLSIVCGTIPGREIDAGNLRNAAQAIIGKLFLGRPDQGLEVKLGGLHRNLQRMHLRPRNTCLQSEKTDDPAGGDSHYERASASISSNLRDTSASRIRTPGSEHPTGGADASSRAFMHFELGEYREALGLLEEALAITGENRGENNAIYRQTLDRISAVGHALRDRYANGGNPEDLQLAIRAAEKIVQLDSPNVEPSAIDLNTLAARLIDRYERMSDCVDLDRAVLLLDKAVDQGRTDSPNLIIYLNNLSTALYHRYSATRDPQDLNRSTELCQKVVLSDRRALSLLLKLVAELIYCGQQNADRHALNNAREAVEKNLIESDFGPQLLCDIAVAWMMLHLGERRNGDADLECGIQASLAAVRLADKTAAGETPSRALAALLLLKRYKITGRTADRDRAIELSIECVDQQSQDGSWNIWLPFVWGELGWQLVNACRGLGNLVALDAAVQFLNQARDKLPITEESGLLNNISLALRYRFEITQDVVDIDGAIEAAERALTQSPVSPKQAATFRHTLASALWYRYRHRGERADLDRGVELCEVSLQQDGKSPANLNGLAIWLMERFFARGDLADLDQAISYWHDAFNTSASEQGQKQRYSNNLAVALLFRAKRTGNTRDLQDAILLTEEAVNNSPAPSPNRAGFLHTLGAALQDRFAHFGNIADLKQAIKLHREATSATKFGGDVAVYENSLANALREIGRRERDIGNVAEAIELYCRLVRTVPHENSLALMVRANLASALRARFDICGDKGDYKLAVRTCEESLKLAIDTLPEVALIGARDWGDWEFQRQSWKAASRAYGYVREASRRLLRSQAYRYGSESWLRETQGVFARAAYAEAKLGSAANAMEVLEFGSARLLSQQLQLYDRSLKLLKGSGHDRLYDQFIQQMEIVRRGELSTRANDRPAFTDMGTSEVSLESLRDARRRLDEIFGEIQSTIGGFSELSQSPSLRSMHATLGGETLVYIAATEAGGFALVLGASAKSDADVLWFPNLTDGAVRSMSDKYWRAYEKWQRRIQDRGALSAWHEQLDQTTQLLWQLAIGQLVTMLARGTKVCLVPIGLLAALPLHAAWSTDHRVPACRRYALDSLCFTYSPNSRALAAAKDALKGCSDLSLLAVADPQPVAAKPLVNSVLEAEFASTCFERHRILRHTDATRGAVIEALSTFSIIHLACHGIATPAEPLDSRLVMAGNDEITLRDLLDLRLDGVRLAILSACETAVPGRDLPDEVISFPTGFLYAGAMGTVSSLWSISDIGTMMLMTRFYWLWRQRHIEPPRAMCLAQIWVRDTTNTEKLAFFDELLEGCMRAGTFEGRDILLSLPPDEYSFAHPFYWAAFTYVGA